MQKIPIRQFAFKLLIFSIVIAALTTGIQLIFPQFASPALPFIVIFFFFVTLFTLYVVLRQDVGKAKKQFVSSYMLSRIIKFSSCLIFLLVYIILNKEDRWNFAIAFLVIYFLYSIFEIIALRGEAKKREANP